MSGSGFSRLTGWTELRELDLTSTPVTDEGMLHIGKMTALERLMLSYSDVTDEGMEPLSKLPHARDSGSPRRGREGSRHDEAGGGEELCGS